MACVGVLMRAVDTVATQLISAKHATTECGKSCDPPRETSAPLHRQQDSCSPNMLRQLRFRWSFAELPPRPVTTFDCVHCDILLSTFFKKIIISLLCPLALFSCFSLFKLHLLFLHPSHSPHLHELLTYSFLSMVSPFLPFFPTQTVMPHL